MLDNQFQKIYRLFAHLKLHLINYLCYGMSKKQRIIFLKNRQKIHKLPQELHYMSAMIAHLTVKLSRQTWLWCNSWDGSSIF